MSVISRTELGERSETGRRPEPEQEKFVPFCYFAVSQKQEEISRNVLCVTGDAKKMRFRAPFWLLWHFCFLLRSKGFMVEAG
jgi:hypothetical protein